MATKEQSAQQGSQSPNPNDDPITIGEFFSLAQKKLPSPVWDYYASGSEEHYSLKRNSKAFERLIIRPRVLRNVATIDTSTSLFGYRYPFPIGIAPSAMQRLVGGEGELDTARAAAKFGTTMILSTASTTSLEDVIQAPKGGRPENFWFQLYVSVNRAKSASLVKRAEAAGYKAVVLTVDTPVLGNRINERKNPIVLPEHLRLANLEDRTNNPRSPMNRLIMEAKSAEEAKRLAQQANSNTMNDASLTWSEAINWLRSQTSLKIIVKGILTAEDALLAIEHGVDAIVVSNHGGRQLDSVSSTIEALPEIVAAVRGRIPVILDGGIRTGSDVFKALALGADFTLIGRPVLWGLSHSGQKGVEAVLNILERELTRTMTLAGVKNIGEIQRDLLGVEKTDGFGIAKL